MKICFRHSEINSTRKDEMMNNLFKPESDIEDEGIMRKSLLDFYMSSGKRQSF